MDLIKLFTFLSIFTIGLVSGAVIRYGCYSSPGSPCTNVTLKCLPDRVVSVDNTIQFGSSTDKCTREDQCLDGSCCRPQNNDSPTPADFQDRLSVFTSCSNQQSCTVTVPYNQSLQYNYISYSYTCLKDEINIDMSGDVDTIVKKQVYLYGNSSNNPSSSLTRICKVQTANHAISVKAFYINLRSESCRKIKISSQKTTLFNCTEEQLVILSEKLNITGNQINITIDDLTLQTDEFIWLEFLSVDDADLAVKCEGMEPVKHCSNCFNNLSSSTESILENSTWIYVVVGAGGPVVIIVLVVIVVYIIKRNKSKESTVNTISQKYSTERHEPIGKLEDASSPYAEPREMISLPSTVCHSDERASPLYYTLVKDRNINPGAAKILNSTHETFLTQPEIKKREQDHGYAQVNKGYKIQTQNHLGAAREPVKENSGSAVYDDI